MTTKITVAEWRQYLSDPNWISSRYIDDSSITVNGNEVADDSDDALLASFDQGAQVKITSGIVEDNDDRDYCVTLRSHFNTWRTMRDHRTLVVTVKRERAEEMAKIIKSFGATIS